jgi:hypothetical protein
MAALLSILIAGYYSIERLALMYFSYAQQDHKLNESGIICFSILLRTQQVKMLAEYLFREVY